MRIAHIVCSYPPYYSGMGNVVLQMVSELVKRGHEAEVYTPLFQKKLPEKPEEYEPEMRKQIKYAKRLKPTIAYGKAARIPQVKRELDKFDIVHLHYPFYGTANIVRGWKLKNPDKPLAITYHMDTRGRGWKGLIFKLYSRYWMPKILQSADVLFVSSFDYLESSEAASLFNQNPKKWIELPFGIDLEKFKPRKKPEALFARHNLNPELPTLIFVGGMDAAHYFKGIPVLLKALILAKRAGTELQAVFVGEGELKEQYALQARGMGLKKVRFVGRIEDKELPYYYNMADLLILPSIHQGEAFGMVLLEAMASGVPVAASDLPGVHTVASLAGLVFPPNNYEELATAILGYFSDAIDRGEWKKRVRAVAEERYNWQGIVDKLEDVYKKLVV